MGIFNVTVPTEPTLTWARFFRQALGLAIVMMSSLGCYLLVLKWRGGAAHFRTHMAWDEWIPFEPAWVWAYLLPYLIGPVALGLVRPATFRWYITRGLVIVALSLLIFTVVPTQIDPRPSDHGLGTGLTAKVYEQMVAIDEPPANAAPSLHVSLTFLLGLALYRDFPRWWPVILLAVVLVWMATLFTRQHHLLDVLTGVGLACTVAMLWPRDRTPSSGGVTEKD
jgi:membrane-associated phospholipid phosphatase